MLAHASLLLPFVTACLLAANPVRIGIMVDRTGSTVENRIPQLSVRDLQPFIDLTAETGGEVAVGAIRDRSDRPLIRCPMEQPPAPQTIDPPPPHLNVFVKQRLFREYNEALDREARAEAIWHSGALARAQACESRLSELLAAGLATTTDIRGAVERLRLFLQEPAGKGATPLRFVVLYTDGIDTAGKGVAVSLIPDTSVLLVGMALALWARSFAA